MPNRDKTTDTDIRDIVSPIETLRHPPLGGVSCLYVGAAGIIIPGGALRQYGVNMLQVNFQKHQSVITQTHGFVPRSWQNDPGLGGARGGRRGPEMRKNRLPGPPDAGLTKITDMEKG